MNVSALKAPTQTKEASVIKLTTKECNESDYP